jgi:hypothetical protein
MLPVRWAFCVLLIAGIGAEGAAMAHCQTPAAEGLLTGVVMDPSGAKVPHAAMHVEGTVTLDVTSDGAGRFNLALPPGAYTVTVRVPGFKDSVATVQVASGATVRVDATLAIAPVIQELTIPAANAANTSGADNASALVFQGADLDTFSSDNATFQQELLSLAGGGIKPPQILINGFSDGRFPPKSSILSVRINRNPYSAAYESLGFGRVEISTKPGGGKLHGQLSTNATHNALNAQNPYIAGSEPPYYQMTFDGNLTGGLGKKTSFFLAGNVNDQQNNTALNAETWINNQPTPFSATVHTPQLTSTYSLRLARQLSTNNTLDGRYEFTQTNLTNGGLTTALTLPAQSFNSGTTNQTLQLIDTQIFGAHVVNESRFQYIRTRQQQDALNNTPTLVVEGSFNGGGNPSQSLHDNQDHYELQEMLSVDQGAHYLRFGARYRLQREAQLSSANYNGQFTFASLTAYAALQPSQFTLTMGQQSAALLTGDLGVYAEDEWKITPHFTLDAGLRVESQSAIGDHLDIAPRLGAAWAIYRNGGKTPFVTLRGGGGAFFDRFSAANILTAVRQNGVSQQTYTLANPAGYPNLPSTALLSATTPTIYRVNPNLKSEYSWIGGITLEKNNKFGHFSANYIAIRGVHQWDSRNINAPLPGTYNPAVPGSGVRPFGGSQNIYEFDSNGITKIQIGYVNARASLGKRIVVFLNANTVHNSENAIGATTFASNSYNLAQDYGRAPQPTNQLFTGGNVQLPFGFTTNLFLSTQGGIPFNITTGTDLNGDSIYNDRPAFATAPTASSVVYNTRFGSFDANPQPGEKIIPINYGNSPNFFFVDLSVSRSVKFGPRPPAPAAEAGKPQPPRPDPAYELGFTVDASNVLNHKNPGLPVGVLGSSLFGQPVSVNNPFGSNPSANRSIFLQTTFTF